MEFALALPLLIVVLLGIFDLGRAVIASSTINNAAREGARLAIVDQTTEHIQDLTAQRADILGIAAADVEVDFRKQTQPNVEGSCDPQVGTGAIVGCFAVVRVPYTYTAAIPIIGNLVGSIHMQGEARFPVAFNCVDPPPDPPVVCPIGS